MVSCRCWENDVFYFLNRDKCILHATRDTTVVAVIVVVITIVMMTTSEWHLRSSTFWTTVVAATDLHNATRPKGSARMVYVQIYIVYNMASSHWRTHFGLRLGVRLTCQIIFSNNRLELLLLLFRLGDELYDPHVCGRYLVRVSAECIFVSLKYANEIVPGYIL